MKPSTIKQCRYCKAWDQYRKFGYCGDLPRNEYGCLQVTGANERCSLWHSGGLLPEAYVEMEMA